MLRSRPIRWLTGIVLLAVAAVAIWGAVSAWQRPKLPPGISQAVYDQAAEDFRRAYGRAPSHTDVLSWMGEVLAAQNNLPAAIVCLEAIPPDDPKYGHLSRYQQAFHFAALNRARQSEAKLHEFFALEREVPQLGRQQHIDALRLLRFLLEVQLRFEERVKVLDQLWAIDGCDTFDTVAYCFPSLLRWNGPAAITWHERFLKQDPQDFYLRTAAGRYLTGQGQLDDAHKILEQCCRDHPASLWARAAYMECLREQGDWTTIGRIIESLPPLDPKEPWLLTTVRGYYHNHQKQFAQAADCFEMLLETDPANSAARHGLAAAYRGLGLDQERKETLEVANVLARIQNRLGWILFHEEEVDPLIEVADLCLEISMPQLSARLANRVRQLAPDAEETKSLLARVQAAPKHVATVPHRRKASPSTIASNSRTAEAVVECPAATREKTSSSRAEPATEHLPYFENITEQAGIHFRRYDDMRGQHRIIESNGGGVAMFDYDGDGLLDLFYTNGCRVPRTANGQKYSHQLYRNLGGNHFECVTVPAGIVWESYGHGCAVGDYDNDGFDDLYVTSFGKNRLWHNNGDGTFSDATQATGTQVPLWNSSVAFADLNRDGNLDLYVVSYVQEDINHPTLCPEPASPDGYITCSPTMYPAADDVLFISDGQGAFVDVTQQAGITGVDGKGLGVVVLDVDQNGWPDIYVANDAVPNFLYMSQKTKTQGQAAGDGPLVPVFEDQATIMGAAVNESGRAESSMGVAFGDYDADGWLDLLLTHFYMGTDTLYRNLQGVAFEDVTSQAKLAAASRSMLSWGTRFIDFENDGWLDLIVVSGNVDDARWRAQNEPYAMHPQVFLNERNGRFRDVSRWAGLYFTQEWLGRGLAAGDLDGDGDLDVAVNQQRNRSVVLRNDTETPYASVIVRLIGRGRSNRSAINARVETEGLDLKVVREIVGGGSYQSACDHAVHIGLGDASAIGTLRIVWPSGEIEEYADVAPGSYIAVQGKELARMP